MSVAAKMAVPFPYTAYSDLPMKEESDGSTGSIGALQCVNPQHTDKRYHGPQGYQPTTVADELMTPPLSSHSDLRFRRLTLMPSDAAASCQIGPVSASSASSFGSSPGYPWSGSGSDSTAPSSRRQSSSYLDSSQCHPSDLSPTPALRPGRSKDCVGTDHCSFSESVASDEAVYLSPSSFGAPTNVAASDVLDDVLAPVSDYYEKAQIELQEHDAAIDGLPVCELSGSTASSSWLDMYPLSNPNEAFTLRPGHPSQPSFETNSPGLFKDAFEPQELLQSHYSLALAQESLDHSLRYSSLRQPVDAMYAAENDDEYRPRIEVRLQRRKQRKQNHKQRGERNLKDGEDMITKKIQCQHCGQKCNRSEHLTRHQRSRHNLNPKKHLCKFTDCKDKDEKRKSILERMDNYKVHYNNTHFSYGSTEKSGKNKRYSMKRSIEEDLREYDDRWTCLLAGGMTVGPGNVFVKGLDTAMDNKALHDTFATFGNILSCKVAQDGSGHSKGFGFVHYETAEGAIKAIGTVKGVDVKGLMQVKGPITVRGLLSTWKMIGYSIRETRDLKVKDIAPEWQGPEEDPTLEVFDPRWKAIKKGTLTYEQAMSVGQHMKETTAQGVLGVTMEETAQMGIRSLDVRWQHLNNGRMSVEDAEKLGVKDEWTAVHARRKR